MSESQSQPIRSLLPSSHYALRTAAESPQERLARLESEYDDALDRANELSGRLDGLIADARVQNTSIVNRARPICSGLGGTTDPTGTCVFSCPDAAPAPCDAKTADFNRQAATLISEKRDMLTHLRVFASLVKAAQTDAANKKQAFEELQAQLEKH